MCMPIFLHVLYTTLEMVRAFQPCRESKCIAGHKQRWSLRIQTIPGRVAKNKIASSMPQARESTTNFRLHLMNLKNRQDNLTTCMVDGYIVPPTCWLMRTSPDSIMSIGGLKTRMCPTCDECKAEVIFAASKKMQNRTIPKDIWAVVFEPYRIWHGHMSNASCEDWYKYIMSHS